VQTKGPEQTYELMKDIFPKGKGYSFHTNLIRFGRRVCRSSSPACGNCPLFDECSYDGKANAKRQRASSTTDHDFMLLDNVPVKR
jgi:endonuclease III